MCVLTYCQWCIIHNIQLYKLSVVNGWRQGQLLASHEASVAELEGEVDRVKRELTETKVTAKEEKKLLRQQVETLQKVSACVYVEICSNI